MASLTNNNCCGCIIGIVILLVVVALVVGFVLSKFYTVEQAGFADTQGVLSFIDENKYKTEDTLRSQGMAGWKVWDFVLWILNNGSYQPATD